MFTLGKKGLEDTVFCLESDTGKVIWQHSYDSRRSQHPGPRATPTVHDGRVYTIGREGDLFCFDAATGDIQWHKNLVKDIGIPLPRRGFSGSPFITGDKVLLNAGLAGLALDKRTGETVWANSPSSTGGYATPVPFMYEGTEYAAIFGATALYIVDTESGKQHSSYPWRNKQNINAADPLIIGNKIFITSNYRKGCALLEFKGNKLELLWQNLEMASHFSAPVFLNGYIYGHDRDANSSLGNLICIDIANGKKMWSKRMGMVSIIVAGGKIIALDAGGILHVSNPDPSAYKEISSAKVLGNISWTPPSFAAGRIYCRNARGDLVCIDASR